MKETLHTNPILELYNDNCIEVLKTLSDNSIDAIISDPPYEVTACDWDKGFLNKLEDFWEEWKRVLKENGVILINAREPFSAELIMSNKSWFKYDWIWNKHSGANFMNLDNAPFRIHEQILVFAKNGKFTFNPQRELRTPKSLKRNPQGEEGKIMHKKDKDIAHYKIPSLPTFLPADGSGLPKSIQDFGNPQERGAPWEKIYESGFSHPTRKPFKMLEYLINTYTNPNDWIFDGFAGSGTTGIASVYLNRNCILCETLKEYCEIIKKRASLIPTFLFKNYEEEKNDK